MIVFLGVQLEEMRKTS